MATMNDIAERVGVSRATVSVVLSGRHAQVGIKDETRRRILDAAQEMRFRVNSSAKAVRTGKFGCVALALGTERHSSFLPASLLDGLHDALAAHDMHLTLARLTAAQMADAGFVPHFLRRWMADGVVINYHGISWERVCALADHYAVPYVSLNVRQEHNCVRPDDFQVGRAAAQGLLALGHRRIAFVDWIGSGHYSAADRRDGYAQALRDAGLTPRSVGPAPSPSEYLAASRQLLQAPDRPTAVVAYQTSDAEPLLYAAATLGLAVPRDLSLVTFADGVLALSGVAVTTWLLPERAMGEAAVEMLLARLDDPNRPRPSRVLPVAATEGDTCAPPTL